MLFQYLDVMSSYATHSQTSFQPVLSSSLHYPTSLQWSNRAYPPNQSIAQWNTGNNLLGINTTRQSPTTQSDGLYDMWGNGGAQSTHSIWSVRNSVTMDEDRSTTEVRDYPFIFVFYCLRYFLDDGKTAEGLRHLFITFIMNHHKYLA